MTRSLDEKGVLVTFLKERFDEMPEYDQCRAASFIASAKNVDDLDFLLNILENKENEPQLLIAVAKSLLHFKNITIRGTRTEDREKIARNIFEHILPYARDRRSYSVALTPDLVTSKILGDGIIEVLGDFGRTTPELDALIKQRFKQTNELDIAVAAYKLNPDAKWAFRHIVQEALTAKNAMWRSDAITALGEIPQVQGRKSMPVLKAVLEKESSKDNKIVALETMLELLEAAH